MPLSTHSARRSAVQAFTVLCSCTLVSCGFLGIGAKKSSNKDTAVTENVQTPASNPDDTKNGDPSQNGPENGGAQYALSQRLTPEQISRQMESATGYRLGWVDSNNTFRDLILEGFNVTLGGVDFQASSERDRLTKVQTVLIVRTIAWSFARFVLWKEIEKPEGNRTFFTHTNPLLDVPESGDAKIRFDAQLNEIYWRFFSRAPSAAETDAIRQTFIDMRNAYPEKETWERNFMAWAGVLYSLLSSIEFWSI